MMSNVPKKVVMNSIHNIYIDLKSDIYNTTCFLV